jgi:hypothetical protein
MSDREKQEALDSVFDSATGENKFLMTEYWPDGIRVLKLAATFVVLALLPFLFGAFFHFVF